MYNNAATNESDLERLTELKLTSRCKQTILDRTLLQLLQAAPPSLQTDFENTRTRLKRIILLLLLLITVINIGYY